MYLPSPARLLYNAIQLKCYQKNKKFEENLKRFNNELLSLNSNAEKIVKHMLNSEDEKIKDDWEQVKSYMILTFLSVENLEVNEENLRLLLNLHFAIECNSFGVSNSEQLRCGTAVYFPSNMINHSCEPNAFIRFSGKKQFLISNQDIEEGEEITISYIDHAYPERIYRQRCLRQMYFFECDCVRCTREKD